MELDQLRYFLQDTKAEITDDGESGRVRIGAIPTIAPYFLPQVLQQFSAEFPRASLVVQENTTDMLLKSCTQGEIDLAILALPVPARYLEVECLEPVPFSKSINTGVSGPPATPVQTGRADKDVVAVKWSET